MPREIDVPQLVAQMRDGSRRALARLLTCVENGHPKLEEIGAAIAPHTGEAQIIGLTGPPGVGKSTSTNALRSTAARIEAASPPVAAAGEKRAKVASSSCSSPGGISPDARRRATSSSISTSTRRRSRSSSRRGSWSGPLTLPPAGRLRGRA